MIEFKDRHITVIAACRVTQIRVRDSRKLIMKSITAILLLYFVFEVGCSQRKSFNVEEEQALRRGKDAVRKVTQINESQLDATATFEDGFWYVIVTPRPYVHGKSFEVQLNSEWKVVEIMGGE